jgi:hypothetical protein
MSPENQNVISLYKLCNNTEHKMAQIGLKIIFAPIIKNGSLKI